MDQKPRDMPQNSANENSVEMATVVEIRERVCQISAAENSVELETVVEIGDIQISESNVNSNGSRFNEANVEERCESVVIDVGSNQILGENQRVCRICHLNAKESGISLMEMMELGCGCKGELGVAHLHCAEAWFRVRGNRLCEICGQTAKNITGVSDNGFMEEWNERRSVDSGTNSSNGNRRCPRGQPLCNFLMACLVVAFVLPWFFRVNMF